MKTAIGIVIILLLIVNIVLSLKHQFERKRFYNNTNAKYNRMKINMDAMKNRLKGVINFPKGD